MNRHQRLQGAMLDVAKRIERFSQPDQPQINEANTKNWLIEPLLRSMGWDTQDPTAVQAEYRAQGAGQNPVDYALMVDGAPALFLEAKALGTSLDTPKSVNQVVAYGAVAGVQWVVITDGDEYRIYRTDTAAAAPEKLLASFRLTDPAHRDEAEQFLGMLDREELAFDKLHGLWTEREADSKVRSVLQDLLSGADAAFVKYLSKRIPGLAGREVAASLRRANLSIAFPKTAVGSVAAPRVPAPAQVSMQGGDRHARLSAALEADGAKWPVQLHRTYKGHKLSASLDRDGAISAVGRAFETFSGSAHAAMVSATGATKPVTVNGWDFWKYTMSDGTELTVGQIAPKV